MRTLKYHLLLAAALLIACSDDNPVEGNRANTPGNAASRPAAVQERASDASAVGNAASHWRGLAIRPERRCSPYERRHYRYSQSVELAIIKGLGGIYSPYTGRCFASRRETDIEHIVALSEAHDSGLCEPAPNIMQLRRAFASDPLNLTLASPELNRDRKQHYDGAEWLPPRNRCWFAQRIVAVRKKYGLTIDRREATALERVLSACSSVEMEFTDCTSAPNGYAAANKRPASPNGNASALDEYDDDGNGRITCKEARRYNITPVRSNHPAYPFMSDGDGDGVVCE